MNIVPARNGWLWLTQGFALFRKSPGMWVLSVFVYWLLVAVVNRVDYIGPVLATVSLPAFSASFIIMAHEVASGGRLTPMLLFSGFRREPRTLLMLGVAYMVCIVAVFALTSFIDDGALLRSAILGKPLPQAGLLDGSIARAMMLAAVLAAPVLTAFWFAPMLAAGVLADRPMGAGKSLFYSFFACWRNWRAFIVYSLAIAGVGILLSIVVAMIVVSLRTRQAVQGAMLAMTLLLLPTVFGSFYACYRDLFAPASPPDPSSASEPPRENDIPSR